MSSPLSTLKNLLYSTAYNGSYYLIYFLHSLRDFGRNVIWYLTPAAPQDDHEQILVSHVYFRPTSPARNGSCSFDTKELVNSVLEELVDSDHTDRDDWSEFWESVNEYLSTGNHLRKKLMPGDTLEIHYTVPFHHPDGTKFRKSYIVPYTYPARINFPPYSLERVREHYHSDQYKPGILSAELGHRDMTNELERWVGPLDNFYGDKPFREGNQVTRKLVVGSGEGSLTITNTDAEDFKFEGDQVLTWGIDLQSISDEKTEEKELEIKDHREGGEKEKEKEQEQKPVSSVSPLQELEEKKNEDGDNNDLEYPDSQQPPIQRTVTEKTNFTNASFFTAREELTVTPDNNNSDSDTLDDGRYDSDYDDKTHLDSDPMTASILDMPDLSKADLKDDVSKKND